jgi:hypothetical protein
MTENALNGFDNLESTINSIFSETASSLGISYLTIFIYKI